MDQQGPNMNNSNEEGMAQGTSDQQKKDSSSLGEGHFCTLKRRWGLALVADGVAIFYSIPNIVHTIHDIILMMMVSS